MALIHRVSLNVDSDDVSVALSDALADLQHIADRLGVGSAEDMVLRDSRDKEAARDVMLARLRRFPLGSSARVSRHNCPHVAGSEEVSWLPCTDESYGFSQEVV